MQPRDVPASEIAAATGGFHPLAVVGEGGFGKVYRGMISHQPVAIKVMASDGLQGASEFDNERLQLPRLRHAHLVRLLGVCNTTCGGGDDTSSSTGAGAPLLRCLVYELMPGGNVEEHLAAAGAAAAAAQQQHQGARCVLPWWLRLRVAAQIAAAVAYLHNLPASLGGPLIHRDIKPANMFLDGRLNAKLGDFGLAIPASSSSSSQQPRSAAGEVDMVGTYPYLPPEYKSSGTISARGDVYALGVSLLQLATGRLERLHDLVPHVRQGLAAGQLAALLDAQAGGQWDETAGQRLLRLGLWAVTEDPDARPSSSVLAQDLARLWVAADQALNAASGLTAAQGAVAQPAAAAASVGGWPGPGLTSWGAGGGGGGGGGGGVGGFWRFLTSSNRG